jgi:hypothetical protein
MPKIRSIVSAVTALAFVAETTGVAHATPPPDVQPVPYTPSQPIPLPQTVPSPPPAAVPAAPMYAPAQPPGVTVILPPAYGGPPPPGSGGVAFVHLEAEQGAVLESATNPRSRQWTAVCSAPCDLVLPLDREYRVSGEDMRNSRTFQLGAAPGQHVFITVSPASKGAFAAGIGLTSVGGGGIIVGLSMLLVGLVLDVSNCADGIDCNSQPRSEATLLDAGAIVSVIGLGVMIGGIVLFATNFKSHASTTVSQLLPGPAPRPDTAWLKAPLWHDGSRESAGMPRPVGFPILSQSF